MSSVDTHERLTDQGHRSPTPHERDFEHLDDQSLVGEDDHLQGFRPVADGRIPGASFPTTFAGPSMATGMSGETQRINANFFALAEKVDSLEIHFKKLIEQLTSGRNRVSHKRKHQSSDEYTSDNVDFSDSESDGMSPEHGLGVTRSTQGERALHRAARSLNSEKRRKSGLQLGAEVNVRKRIQWPHQFILRNSTPVRFETLSIAELISGLMAMIDNAKRKGRSSEAHSIKKLTQAVLEDAKSIEWPLVRRSVQAALIEIERGNIEWTQIKKINDTRRWDLMMPVRRGFTNGPATRTVGTRGVACQPFQTGGCPVQSSDHMSDKGAVKHICAYCMRAVGKEFPHPEKSCRRKRFDNGARDNYPQQDAKAPAKKSVISF